MRRSCAEAGRGFSGTHVSDARRGASGFVVGGCGRPVDEDVGTLWDGDGEAGGIECCDDAGTGAVSA